MKLTLRLADRVFHVEVADLGERPIVATVDGERFEVWPEEHFATPPEPVRPVGGPAAQPRPIEPPRPARLTSEKGRAPAARAVRTVHAPIPGVIDSVAVKAGDVVEVGQGLCVLEAMKMKNVIRAPQAAEIASVHVTPGQHVKHYDLLVEFVE